MAIQPAPFEDRAEFLSEKWIGHARAYLQRRVDQCDARIDQAQFSLCEIMTDCPARPWLSAGEGAWHVKLAGRSLEVGRGVLPDADMVVRGRYFDVLQLARTVYSDDAEVRELALHEIEHRLGGPAVRTETRRPASGAAAFLMKGLHDHLAQRTIDAPKLEERVAGYGLRHHARELEEQGYTVLERAVSERFADALSAAIVGATKQTGTLAAGMLLERGRIFELTALHPWLYALAETLCGKGMLLGQLLGLRKRTGPGEIGLHTDYVHVREPFPEQAQMCTAIWALEDFTAAAGSTWLISGSHRLKRHPRAEDDLSAAVPLVMPKGSIAIWDGALWHWQGARELPGERVTLHSTYMQATMRPYDDYLALSNEVLARNPPELATLAGLDDVFGKNTHAGQKRELFARALEVRREPA